MEKNGSRLLQMQARFQQKQMQEREMKIASLYEAQQARALDRVRHSPGSGVSAATTPTQAPASHQPGKVRQMFEERRTKGIDKSYPLQPIHNTPPRKALPNGYTKVSNVNSSSKLSVEKRAIKTRTTTSTHSVKKQQQKIDNIVNGSGDLNHNHEPDLNTVKHPMPQSNGEVIPSADVVDARDNYMLEDETFPEALAPMLTPRSPQPQTQPQPQPDHKKPPARNPAQRISQISPVKTKAQPTSTPPRRVTSENTATPNNKARGAMQRTVSPTATTSANKARSATSATSGVSAATAPAPAGSAGVGAECSVCARRFAPERLAKHQEICRKAHAKKRKPFDALKHRLAGTEAEPFINKLRKGTNPSSTKVTTKPLNSTWRQKHEDFIKAIRAAKQVQAHLDAGGKLSDLPPPPPSENPDYVQCPHCNRRFNQAAAERHIPKCASFQFNKAKPAAKRR